MAREVALPDGFASIKLRMTDSELKTLVPDTQITVADSSNSQLAPSFHYAEAKVPLAELHGIEGCQARLQFFEHKLSAINVDCGDAGRVEAALRKAYGPATSETDEYLRWAGSGRTLTFSKAGGTLTLVDDALTQALNSQLLMLVMQSQHTAPTPSPLAKTPAAAKVNGGSRPSNEAKAAKHFQLWAEAEPDEGPAPLAVQLTCEPLGIAVKADDLRFSWDFGDDSDRGTTGTTTHTFDRVGTYTVRCAATSVDGVRAEDTVEVEVTEPSAR